MRAKNVAVWLAAGSAALFGAAGWAPGAGPADAGEIGGDKPQIVPAPSRADIAREYLRVDRAFTGFLDWSGANPDETRLREFNLRFDHVTNLFFQSKMIEAVEELRSLKLLIERVVPAAHSAPERDPVAAADADCPNADQARETLLRQIGEIRPGGAAQKTLVEIEKARASLISRRPDWSNSESFMEDWNCARIEGAFAAGVEELRKGKAEGLGDRHDYWPLIIPDGPPIAMRKPSLRFEYGVGERPQSVASDAGKPVIIALHGAGGDETMFQYAYGAGMLLNEASDRGAILVCPRTEFFGFYPDALPKLLDQLELFEKIDRSRVYLIGHSLGAQAALGLARKHHEVVRAVVLIAGGIGVSPRAGAKPAELPPTLMIAGEIDRIFPAARLEQEIRSAKAAGFDVELRVKKNYGHVFVVNGSLHEAVEWLENKGLPKSKAAAQP